MAKKILKDRTAFGLPMDVPLTGVAASVNSPLLQDPAGIPYWVITSQGGLGPQGPAEEPQKIARQYAGHLLDHSKYHSISSKSLFSLNISAALCLSDLVSLSSPLREAG